MKKISLLILLFCAALFCLTLLAAAAGPTYQTQREVKRYFPGDYVHIMVEAPPDTAKISGIMPNGDIIELVHDRRADIWTGLWQVPIGFQAGSYNADLQATDIEGNKYNGQTSPFLIGELTIITMIQKSATPGAETPAQQGERLGRETALLAASAEVVPQPEAVPQPVAPPPPQKIAAPPAKKKVAVVVKKKTTRIARPKQIKQIKFVEVDKSKDLNLAKAKIVTTARYYMERMDFDKVHGQLSTLVKIDPHNQAYKKMLQRVDKVIQAEKERNK
jgi:hypothetical protein